jgi:hypothetical protein
VSGRPGRRFVRLKFSQKSQEREFCDFLSSLIL